MGEIAYFDTEPNCGVGDRIVLRREGVSTIGKLYLRIGFDFIDEYNFAVWHEACVHGRNTRLTHNFKPTWG